MRTYQVRDAVEFTAKEHLPGWSENDEEVEVFSFSGKRKLYRQRRRTLRLWRLTIPVGRWYAGRWVV